MGRRRRAQWSVIHWPSRLSLLFLFVRFLLDGPPQTVEQAAGELLVRSHLNDSPDVGVEALLLALGVVLDEIIQFPHQELLVLIVGGVILEQETVPPGVPSFLDEEGGVIGVIAKRGIKKGVPSPTDQDTNNRDTVHIIPRF